jgi:hypothetical protein
MSMACSMKFIQNFGTKDVKGRENLKDLGVNTMVILKWM